MLPREALLVQSQGWLRVCHQEHWAAMDQKQEA